MSLFQITSAQIRFIHVHVKRYYVNTFLDEMMSLHNAIYLDFHIMFIVVIRLIPQIELRFFLRFFYKYLCPSESACVDFAYAISNSAIIVCELGAIFFID